MNTNQRERRFDVLKRVAACLLGLCVVFWTCVSASGAPGDKKEQSDKSQAIAEGCTTQVFRHTYDDVFQATKEALERKGQILDTIEKERGTISYKTEMIRIGRLYSQNACKMVIDLRIESLASTAEPRTRVTVTARDGGSEPKLCRKPYGTAKWEDGCFKSFFSDIQKVLVTYD